MYFNEYLLKAVEKIDKEWSKLGYKNKAYTHDLTLGSIKFKATNAPYTMCVAAQMEIIVTALNIYCNETGDISPYNYLSNKQWTSLKTGTFKDLVWVNSGSKGTADALEKFGMGKIVPFEELTPGSFINLNRTTKSGHATLFIGYLDKNGNILTKYSKKVVGFKYYSSQGKKDNGGFDYRYAFFDGFCPSLSDGKRRDCKIIRSKNQKYLNTGLMFLPQYWNAKSRDKIINKAFKRNSLSKSKDKENGMNPRYMNQVTIDD